MKQFYTESWPQFYTATIYEWKHLLADDSNKEIIIDSLRYLVTNKKVVLNAFVIMSNHFHCIWQPLYGFSPSDIQTSFLKFTAQQLKKSLEKRNQELLTSFLVNKPDRQFQIWKRRSLSIELSSDAVFEQKLNYIHYNPVKAGLCVYPEDYYYSSAKFNNGGKDDFGILTHYSGN